jgi:uncharacterized protein (TIGR03083 family)
MLDDAEIFERTTRVRLLVADTVETLSAEQWEAPTLCDGWDVRTLVAHLGQPLLVGFGRMVITALRHGGDIDKAVDATARRLARRPIDGLIAVLRQHAERRISPARVGPYGPFVDACVHLRDLARPLHLDADVRPDDWVAVLDYLVSDRVAPTLVPPDRLGGLLLRATDADWRAGRGADELAGPLETLALAATGRSAVCAELTGPGVAVLTGRLRREREPT